MFCEFSSWHREFVSIKPLKKWHFAVCSSGPAGSEKPKVSNAVHCKNYCFHKETSWGQMGQMTHMSEMVNSNFPSEITMRKTAGKQGNEMDHIPSSVAASCGRRIWRFCFSNGKTNYPVVTFIQFRVIWRWRDFCRFEIGDARFLGKDLWNSRISHEMCLRPGRPGWGRRDRQNVDPTLGEGWYLNTLPLNVY